MRNGVLMMLGQLIIPSKDDSFLKPEAVDNLLSVLVDRIHDVNAFTRGTALKVWISLCEYVFFEIFAKFIERDLFLLKDFMK